MAERQRPLVFGLVALASILLAWAVIERWLRLLIAMKSLDPSRATQVHRYSLDLLCRIGEREIDLSFIMTGRVTLEEGHILYETFRDKEDNCIELVLAAQRGLTATRAQNLEEI